MEFVPVHLVDRKIAAKLVIDDLNIENKENIEELLTFKMTSYDKLNKLSKVEKLFGSNYSYWNDTFATVNHFLSLTDDDTKKEIVYALTLMHKDIIDFFTDDKAVDVSILTKKLSAKVDQFDMSCNLCDKLREFVVDHVPIGLMPNAGKRPQDSDRLTFYPDDVVTLMSITLLCKLMSPIFGTMMTYLIKQVDIKAKESCCVAIFTDLFDRKFEYIIDKLKNYISHTVNNQFKEETTMSLMHGYDAFSLSYAMYSQLLIRQFVNVPLVRKDKGNLITYILVSVKKAITTIRATVLKKPTYTRLLYASDSDDDGNTSRLEIDSMTSRTTCDVPMLIKCAVPHTIKKYLTLFDIDLDEYDRSITFFKSSPVHPSKLNKDMNSMFYSRDFGGGKGILMLKAKEYSDITALLQLVLFTLSADEDYRQLAHMLTALPSLDSSLGFSYEDNKFRLNAGSSIGYRNCRARFENSPFGLKGREWDNHIEILTNDLIQNKYRYNTPNWVWEWLDVDNMNGQLIDPDSGVIAALCDFYDFLQGMQQS